MDSPYLNPFERSLMANQGSAVRDEGYPRPDDDPSLPEAMESCRRLAETLAVRKQIDGFLGGAGKLDEVGALLLTIITTGHLFAYNRALLLLTDPRDGHIRGNAGIGTLSKEEAWHLWADILDEDPDLERLVKKAIEDFNSHKQRLAPLLKRFDIDPLQEDQAARAFRVKTARVFTRSAASDASDWFFNALGTDEAGVIPMWGYYGHFGVLLVDNFASGRPLSDEGLQLLEGFVKPFISALEKALIIERYQREMSLLQEANARIEAQHEMLLRMERQNTVGRFAATLAHNLLNPFLSMSGHLGKMERAARARGNQGPFIEALRQDVRDLEEFLADFISQVQQEFPNRHFWDLNHLIREVIVHYRRFHNILTPDITLEEEDVPLVRLDYERVTDSLSRLLGVMSLLLGDLGGSTISTAVDGSSVRIDLRARCPFPQPPSNAAEEVRNELVRLKDYLAEEEIDLTRGEDCFTLTFRI